MADKKEEGRMPEKEQKTLISSAIRALSAMPKSAQVPAQEWQRMKARAEWEDASRSSDLQVSGKLP
jgi:hypothetical protein